MKELLLQRLKTTFGWNRILCRLIAAWSLFAAGVVLQNRGFVYLSFMQEGELSLDTLGIAVLCIFVLYTLLAFLVGKWHFDSWVLLLGATICVACWLSEYVSSVNETLFTLAVTLAYGFFLVYVVRRNRRLLEKFRPGNRFALVCAIAFGLISAGMIAAITCLRYVTFSSPHFDFGIFCNMFYNMKESGIPMVSCERDQLLSHFAVHLSPIYYLLLPFYWLFPSPLTLQIGQAVILGAGVIPVYFLCKHFGLPAKVTLVVTALYAFYPAISTGCFYDLHENCFLTFFLLWVFYFFERMHYLPMYLSALCVLMVKEDAAVYLMIFAIYLLLSRRSRLHGAGMLLLSCGYFAFAAYYLEKHGLGMMVNRFTNLIYDDNEGLFGAIRTALYNPGYLLLQLFTTSTGTWEKVVYFLQMLLPLGMLPFCSKRPSRWLLLTPILFNMLTMYPYQYQLGFQYHFGITAFLFYAMIQNLPELQVPTRRTLLSMAAAACCCFYLSMVTPTFSYYRQEWVARKDDYARMEAILDTIPEDASVCASTFLLPHISDREEIYEVAYHGGIADVEYVALDLRYESTETYERQYRMLGYVPYAREEGLVLILVAVDD